MKKILVLLLVLIGAYIGLKIWSPKTLDRAKFWKNKQPAQTAPLPPPEPAPSPASVPAPSTTVKAPAPEEKPPAPQPAAVDKTAQVVVLCYHRLEGSAGGTYSITPELFEQHLQRLKDSSISVISMQDFLAWRRGEKSIPSRSVLITLDDGYVSAFDVARPILKKFDYPWTYFVYTNYVGAGGKSITWEQLQVLRDEGVEIGSHTVSHKDLRDSRGKTPEAYETWLREEILGSKKLLEQRLGGTCSVFAYPVGGWNARIVELVREAGYACAFTVFGQRITHSASAERLGRYAWDHKRPADIELAFRFQGPLAPSAEPGPVTSQPAPVLLTQPANGETIRDSQPVFKTNLAAFGELEPASVALRLSDVGAIPCKFDPTSKSLEARPAQPLKPGSYIVTVTAKAGGKPVEAKWRFQFEPAGGATTEPATLGPR